MSGQADAPKLAPGTPLRGVVSGKRWRKTAGGAGRVKWIVLPGFAATHHARISQAWRIQMRTLPPFEHRPANDHPPRSDLTSSRPRATSQNLDFLFQYIFFRTTTFLKTKDRRDSQSSLNISANTAATQSPSPPRESPRDAAAACQDKRPRRNWLRGHRFAVSSLRNVGWRKDRRAIWKEL